MPDRLVRRAGAARVLTDAAPRAGGRARRSRRPARRSPASLTVVLTDDEELRDLNRAHSAGTSRPTSCRSRCSRPSAYPDHAGQERRLRRGDPPTRPRRPGGASADGRGAHPIGDIAVSVERAIEQAEAGRGGQTGNVRWSPADELRLLVTHGDAPPLRLGPRRARRRRPRCAPLSSASSPRTAASARLCTIGPRAKPGGPVPGPFGVSRDGAEERPRSRRSSSGWATRASSTRRRATTSAGWSSTAWPTGPGGPGAGGIADAAATVGGRYQGLDLLLVKPMTYMNDSGIAVRKVLARDARAAAGDARRGRRLRPAVRQAPLPRGRRSGRPQRPALDHRRARERGVQPAAGRHRRAGPGVPWTMSCRLPARRAGAAAPSCSMRRRTRSRRGPARARAGPRTASTRSSCDPPTNRATAPAGAGRRAARRAAASAGPGPAGARSGPAALARPAAAGSTDDG